MIDHGTRIFCTIFYVFLTSLMPFVNVFVGNKLELWNPSLNVYTFRVVVSLLAPGIENSKVWGSISPISHSPLPSSRVLHGAIIN